MQRLRCPHDRRPDTRRTLYLRATLIHCHFAYQMSYVSRRHGGLGEENGGARVLPSRQNQRANLVSTRFARFDALLPLPLLVGRLHPLR